MSTTETSTAQHYSEQGIRTEIVVSDPDCPLAEASRDGSRISDVRRSTASSKDDVVIEEFDVEGGVEPTDPRMEKAFDMPDRSVYRLPRAEDKGCVCEVVESYDCVVSDVSAEDGDLHLTFYASNAEEIRSITQALDAECESLSLRQLTRSGDVSTEDLVFVDAGCLTERQREVLETAYEMGYFDQPKGANASEVADEVGVAHSTFREHLSAAESKILKSFLGR